MNYCVLIDWKSKSRSDTYDLRTFKTKYSADAYAAKLREAMTRALDERDFRYLFKVAKFSRYLCDTLLTVFDENPNAFSVFAVNEDECPQVFD